MTDAAVTAGRQRRAMVLLWIVPALWSSNYIIARLADGVVAPHALAFGRWALALVLMAPFVWRELFTRGLPWHREWKQLLVLGATGMWICGAWVYLGGQGTTAANMALIYAATPVAIAVAGTKLLHERMSRAQGVAVVFALAGVVMLLVIDTFLPRAVIQLKPSQWPTTSGDPQPYWWPAEVRATADQPLSSNPVGCVYLPQGADKPSVLQNGQRAYSCTRLLTGIAGMESAGQGLVRWTLDEWLSNESQWDHYQQYFNQMIPEARNRKVIILDNDSKVIGIETLQSLMDRYPATTDSGSTSATDGAGSGSS